MPLAIGARIGPYEVLEPIGAGGMGEVFRARDTTLQRDVALKVLPDLFAHDPERLARFQREAQVLASLNHPHIAQVYGFESTGDVRVLVMEFVPGETLEQRLEAQGSRLSGLPASEVLDFARQIAEALEAAHEHGIVHRDLKPANVKVTPDGSVKVLDFGLAKLALASDSSLRAPGMTQSPTMTSPVMVTSAGMLLGTAAYMAPEQARGKAVDKRADIWAFGCVLLELLCGKPAFGGETVTDVLSAIVAKEPDWGLLPASTPPQLRALIERCLVKDPRARLRDIGEARIALGLDSASQHATSSTSQPAQPWRERAAWTMAVIGFLAAVAAFARGSRPPNDVAPGALQLSVDLPAGLQIVNSGDPRLSPDGAQLVFRANDGRGFAFWLHDLRLGGPPQRLADTGEPFGGAAWAPDSSAFAFFTAGGLRALDLASGAVRTISTVPTNIGNPSASWGANGEILIGGARGNLYRVAAAGGTPVSLTVLREGEIGHDYPTFLQDGRRFVFNVNHRAGPSTNDDEVWLSSLEQPQGHLLLSGARGMFVAPDALLTVRDGTLSAHRFDLDQGTVAPAFAVLPITLPAFANGYSYSALTNVLAFRPSGPDLKRRLAWYDRTGRLVGEIAVPDNAQGVEIAPDASRVVFEVFEAGLPSRDLWVAGLTTGASQKVVFTSADESDAKWMPDSRTIVFGARTENAGPIMQLALDSAEPPTALTALKPGANQYPTSLSRDGRILVFAEGNAPFWLLLSGSQPKPLIRTAFRATPRPRVSPDGRWFIYESTDADRQQVFLEPLPPTGARWPISRDGGTWARWHPNGREIYFIGPDDAMMTVAFQATPTVQLSPPTRLFQTRIAQPTRSGVHANYDVAPDGRFLIVENTAPAEQSSGFRVIVNWQSLLPSAR